MRLTYEMIGSEHRQRRTTALGEAQLARAAQNGDAASLGVLLERHRAALYALALRILGRGPEAQDAVQDTFLIALNSIDQLRAPEAVGGWLRGIVRNVCLRRLREKRGESLFEERPSHIMERYFESSAEEAIDRLALRDWVWAALYELPEVLRVTAMLRYFGSYSSYEEIATILGVPVGTVRSRLNQVKAKLADALLRTAGLEHDEASRLTDSQTRYFSAVFDEYNKGQGYEIIVDALSDDFLHARSDGASGGLEWFMEELEDDLETGMKVHLTNIIASRDVTVVEGILENPPDNLFHCPPATSQVYFYRDGRIRLMREYFAPRPEREKTTHQRKL
jgi:RNA polymerase sigma-70 factor (ECF subfamily)